MCRLSVSVRHRLANTAIKMRHVQIRLFGDKSFREAMMTQDFVTLTAIRFKHRSHRMSATQRRLLLACHTHVTCFCKRIRVGVRPSKHPRPCSFCQRLVHIALPGVDGFALRGLSDRRHDDTDLWSSCSSAQHTLSESIARRN